MKIESYANNLWCLFRFVISEYVMWNVWAGGSTLKLSNSVPAVLLVSNIFYHQIKLHILLFVCNTCIPWIQQKPVILTRIEGGGCDS